MAVVLGYVNNLRVYNAKKPTIAQQKLTWNMVKGVTARLLCILGTPNASIKSDRA